jgi:hypothetical protein
MRLIGTNCIRCPAVANPSLEVGPLLNHTTLSCRHMNTNSIYDGMTIYFDLENISKK